MTDHGNTPYGKLLQTGFVVPSIDSAIEAWVAKGVGPFFVMSHVELPRQRYRGEPTDVDMSVAIAYSGEIQVELIEQHCDAPSIYREFLAEEPAGGMHHLGFLTDRFDEAVGAAASADQPVVQEWENALGARFAYLKRRPVDGVYVELLERERTLEKIFAMIARAAEGWDGSEPRRTL